LEKVFAVDGAVGMEELVGDVGQDGGTAGGDAAFGDENEEAGEKLVDGDGGIELGEVGQEFRGEVVGVVLWRLGHGGAQSGVAEAKVGVVVQDRETALAAVGGVMSAAWVLHGAGFSRLVGHFLILSRERWAYTPVVMKRVRKQKKGEELDKDGQRRMDMDKDGGNEWCGAKGG
jgi:hypothetical protein